MSAVRPLLPALFLLLFAAPADAGLFYRFTESGEDGGQVWVEGERSRVEWQRAEEPFAFDVRIDAASGPVWLNTSLGTWYSDATAGRPPSGPGPELAVGRGVFQPLFPNAEATIEDPEVSVELEEGLVEEVAGLPATKYVVRISYRWSQVMFGETIRAKVSATALLWVTDRLERRPLPVDPLELVTGLPEVDAVLAPELAKIPGFPLRRTLTVTRTMPHTPPNTSFSDLVLEEVRQEPVSAERFEVPAEYSERAPEFGGVVKSKTGFPGFGDEPEAAEERP